MFKRVRWMGMGAVAGVGASAWAQRRLRRTLEEHPSIRTGADVVSTARRLGRELSAAVADGRQAMAEREAALRAGIDARLGADAAGRADPAGGVPAHEGAAPGVARPALRIVDTTSGAPRPARAAVAPGATPLVPTTSRPPGGRRAARRPT